MHRPSEDRFVSWFAALERRHLDRLTFQEVRRALQALSSLYVERRARLEAGGALDSAGKRAAFALFYGPLHFLLVRQIVRALEAARPAPARIIDLGCGTGAASAAWALEAGGKPLIAAVDRSAWAIAEAEWTFRTLGLRASARRDDLERARSARRGEAVLAAFTVNELAPQARSRLLGRLLSYADAGARVLVVEPLARRGFSFWDDWSALFVAAGGRADTWDFEADLPERLELLDRAAGLDHARLIGRSLWIGP
jgi:SAM-dependent methyltransferase